MPGEPTIRGISCPTCRGQRLAVSYTHQPAPGVRVRYRECSACGTRMKTRETVAVVFTARRRKAN
ncbi:MAG TPA: hypothetical protein VM529_18075 [Gemmata sp.]|jgi:transcriptional regulator NrdR family protein|nr:hypothetical protein [Gemmata sp.]